MEYKHFPKDVGWPALTAWEGRGLPTCQLAKSWMGCESDIIDQPGTSSADPRRPGSRGIARREKRGLQDDIKLIWTGFDPCSTVFTLRKIGL
jgi:hypothetical protein